MSDAVPIRPAATVVLIKNTPQGVQTLLLRRNSKVSFAGGAWVFPGGRVEPEEIASFGAEEAARVAAVRECEEEAGISLLPRQLQLFAHWTTPANQHKRFATAFYIVEVEQSLHEVTIDGSEIHDHAWVLPAEVVAGHRRGEWKMMPPTFITLSELARAENCAQALAYYRQRELRVFEPKVTTLGDTICMLYSGDAGYSAADPNNSQCLHRTVLDEHGCQYFCDLD